MRTIVVIPVYNEQDTIVQVAKKSLEYCDEVVVVDDCSTDKTPQIIQKLGIKYALHGKNQGVGAATRTGISMAMKHGADIVVTLDGDGQHAPEHIDFLLSGIQELDAELAIGSRFLDKSLGHIPAYRKFGIDVITWLYNVGSKFPITDSQCCFRAFRREVLENIQIEENGFGFSTEMLVKARKKGFRIVEVPVKCIYHENYRRNSTLNPFRHGFEVAWKTIFWRIKLLN